MGCFKILPKPLVCGVFVACFLNSSCVSYSQKLMVKRDRYGESPVVDMRSGTSALEHVADEDKQEAKKEKSHKD